MPLDSFELTTYSSSVICALPTLSMSTGDTHMTKLRYALHAMALCLPAFLGCGRIEDPDALNPNHVHPDQDVVMDRSSYGCEFSSKFVEATNHRENNELSAWARIVNDTPTVGQSKARVCTAAGGATTTKRANSTAYALGTWATWTTGATAWECTKAGVSATAPPSISGLVVGGTVVDGTATWILRSLRTATFVSEGNL